MLCPCPRRSNGVATYAPITVVGPSVWSAGLRLGWTGLSGSRPTERYWKYPELAELRLTSPLEPVGPEAALLAVLRSAWLIATPWALGAPDAEGEFHGIASLPGSHFTVPGVEWMQFQVDGRRWGTSA
ncbi:hypothetical protein STENM327S_04095 [Streptomyces tendae]